jgi:hypothetical protein
MISPALFPAKAGGPLMLESAITAPMETFHLSTSRAGGLVRPAFPAMKTARFSPMKTSAAKSSITASAMKPAESSPKSEIYPRQAQNGDSDYTINILEHASLLKVHFERTLSIMISSVSGIAVPWTVRFTDCQEK